MSILEKRKSLLGKQVKVTCTDGQIFEGRWSEWWDEEDNDYLADEGIPVCESILLDTAAYPMEIVVDEIADIQEA